MPDDPIKPPRFPYVGALLCAACLGAAVWTWMTYSYVLEVTPEDIVAAGGARDGRYVRLRTKEVQETVHGVPPRKVEDLHYFYIHRKSGGRFQLYVRAPAVLRPFPGDQFQQCLAHPVRDETGELVFVGRVRVSFFRGKLWSVKVDTTASRFHGASVGGLVVGAMGVFVFAVALRHWLGERRRFREEARA